MGATKTIKNFGLIGKTLCYSFSKKFFDEKFSSLQLPHTFSNFEFADEKALGLFLLDEVFQLQGFSVTIPYKEIIIPYLDKLEESAKKTQAVNSVSVRDGKLIGYNTDSYGFSKALQPHLKKTHKKALILGTGGASKAVAYALTLLKIKCSFVSRKSQNPAILSYKELDKKIVDSHQIIINTTPLGTFPNITDCPNIPYQHITDQHIAFDLVYNPEETLFLKKAKQQGACIENGLAMLHLQAEKSWEIWNTVNPKNS